MKHNPTAEKKNTSHVLSNIVIIIIVIIYIYIYMGKSQKWRAISVPRLPNKSSIKFSYKKILTYFLQVYFNYL